MVGKPTPGPVAGRPQHLHFQQPWSTVSRNFTLVWTHIVVHRPDGVFFLVFHRQTGKR